MLLAVGNRDPRRFTAPDRFWPERPHNARLSFGGGVHHCLGAALARMEGEAALTAVATRPADPRLVAHPPPYRQRGPEELRVACDRSCPKCGTPVPGTSRAAASRGARVPFSRPSVRALPPAVRP
ncbi:cytochrome P450 [Streptomyces sp. NPDC096040]|uniref:cytochrome P450 n=1 Tax=Streptomyces sp. NPDC096040 TaxID=3155541 RepID=UPI003319BC12